MAIYPDYDDVLIHPGRYLTAEWYYTIEGKMPARDYYDALAEVDQDRFDDGTYATQDRGPCFRRLCTESRIAPTRSTR